MIMLFIQGSTAPTEIDVYTFDAFEDRISQRGAATEEGINPRKIVEARYHTSLDQWQY